MNPEDDPLEQLKALKKAPAFSDVAAGSQTTAPVTPEAPAVDPLEELKRSKGPKPKIGQMGHAITEDASPDPSYLQQAAGGVAALAHDIPGAEAAQAGVRSLARGQSYTDALSDIKGAEESANPWVRRGNNIVGGTVAALAGPKGTFMNPLGKGGSAAVQAARFGAAQGALSSDPTLSNQDRILKAGKSGARSGFERLSDANAAL